MELVKKNWISVVFGVIALLAIVASFYPLNKMIEDLKSKATANAAAAETLQGLRTKERFQPTLVPGSSEQVKLDMKLIRGIESNSPRQAIVRAIAQVCLDLGIDVIAEGVETADEYGWLAEQHIRLFQGYLFAKPAFAALPAVRYPPFA